jgi:hypothetical protein
MTDRLEAEYLRREIDSDDNWEAPTGCVRGIYRICYIEARHVPTHTSHSIYSRQDWLVLYRKYCMNGHMPLEDAV